MNKYVYVPMETFKNTECSSVLTQNVLGLWSDIHTVLVKTLPFQQTWEI